MDGHKILLIEWRGAEVPESMRAQAETHARALDGCGRMRRISIELRYRREAEQYRVCCGCKDRRRSITASRGCVTAAIEAFGVAQRSHCGAESNQE